MVSVNLVPERRDAVLAEENGTLELVHLLLAGLDLEPKACQIRPEYGQDIVALQALGVDLGGKLNI